MKSLLLISCLILTSQSTIAQFITHDSTIQSEYKENIFKAKQFKVQNCVTKDLKSENSTTYQFQSDAPLLSDTDSDDDGMPDSWETTYNLDPNDPKDAWGDIDSDEVANLFEFQLGSDPTMISSPLINEVKIGNDIEYAISNAPAGCVIRIQGGTYLTNYISPYIMKKIMLQGGWNDDFSIHNDSLYPTTIDGSFKKSALNFQYKGVTSALILEGLNIQNGTGWSGSLFLLVNGSNVNISIKNCSILNNSGVDDSDCGLFLVHWNYGNSNVFIANTLIANNENTAIYNQTTGTSNAKWHILNSTISNNKNLNTKSGYGILAFTIDEAILTIDIKNSIIWGNGNQAMNLTNNITAIASNSNIDSVSTLYGYSNIANFTKNNAINVNPLFRDTLSFSLMPGSQCIDKGIDIGLQYRGIAPDMGAFEASTSILSFNIEEVLSTSVYPNPVSEFIKIKNISTDNLLYTITDLSGNILLKGILLSKEINVSNLSSGLYILNLTGNRKNWHTKFIKK